MMKFKYLLIALAALPLAACAEVVEEGNVGIEKNLGAMSTEALTPGFYWYNPFTTDIKEVNVQSQVWNSDTEAYTQDLQQADVAFTLNYSLDRAAAATVYSRVGADWSARLIPAIVTAKIKEVFGRNPAVGVIANRQTVQSTIENAITTELATRHINVDNFEITDVSFSEAYENAVEAKEVAVQQAQRAVNVTVIREEEARQAVITANGEAEAMRVRANALSANPNLIQYEEVINGRRAIAKWNGIVCPSNSTCVFGEAGSTPFINLNNR